MWLFIKFDYNTKSFFKLKLSQPTSRRDWLLNDDSEVGLKATQAPIGWLNDDESQLTTLIG